MQRAPATPAVVPTMAEKLLAAARARCTASPPEAHVAMRDGVQLVDIRSDSQRAADGTIPGAVFVARKVLEWRLDPACPHRDERLARRRVANQAGRRDLGDPLRGLA